MYFKRSFTVNSASSIHTPLQDKVLAQNKVVKAEEMNPYHNLESGLANILKPIEDFCTKFFVGTEVSWNYLLLKLIFLLTLNYMIITLIYVCFMKVYNIYTIFIF